MKFGEGGKGGDGKGVQGGCIKSSVVVGCSDTY